MSPSAPKNSQDWREREKMFREQLSEALGYATIGYAMTVDEETAFKVAFRSGWDRAFRIVQEERETQL